MYPSSIFRGCVPFLGINASQNFTDAQVGIATPHTQVELCGGAA